MATGRQISTSALNLYRLHNLVISLRWTSSAKVTTAANYLDDFTIQLIHERTKKIRNKINDSHDQTTDSRYEQYKLHNIDITKTAHSRKQSRIQTNITDGLSERKHEDLKNLLFTKNFTQEYLIKLFTNYSDSGSIEKIIFLQEYAQSHCDKLYSQYGKFDHFLARAYCLRGNSAKGLSILSEAYAENTKLRNSYCTFFRDLIVDSVSNRSVASLVTFKTFVTKWSEEMNEHYPLVCLWHSCWSSSWFSDQKCAEELLELHEPLRKIVAERASALTIYALVNTKEDDAVVKLLQTLLRFKMMEAYEKSLQILFEFRLKNRDARGCSEILQNTKVLGLKLCNSLQSRYIHMIINRRATVDVKPVKSSTSIKFKF